MPMPQLYIIDYRLHGQSRTFIIRQEKMDNAQAWHWASCDAGIGIIPKFGREKIRKVSRPLAERYGVTDVSWRLSGTGAAFAARPFDPAQVSSGAPADKPPVAS